jgi:hypothetical protein
MLVALLLLFCTGCSRSPTPDAVMRKMAAFYQEAHNVQVASELTTTFKSDDREGKMTQHRSVAIQRPNLLSVTIEKDAGMELICDGDKLYTSMPALQSYREAPAPQNCEELLKVAFGGNVLALFPLELMMEDVHAALMAGVTSSTYVGSEKLGGVSAHRLKFSQQDFSWEIWIAADGDPLVLQVATDTSAGFARVSEAFGGARGSMQSTIVERFRNWKIDTELPKETFVFSPPPGAKAQNGGLAELIMKGLQSFAGRSGAVDRADTSRSSRLPITRPASESEPPLQIISAFYGVNQSWFDVTEKVQASVGDSSYWSVTIDNADWGDPAPGFEIGNTLIVHYASGGVARLAREYQGRAITLAPFTKPPQKAAYVAASKDPGKIGLITAIYGVNQSWIDVTEKLRDKAEGKEKFSTIVDNGDWGDPAPGYEQGNTLIVRFQIDGKQRIAACYEGREIRIP